MVSTSSISAVSFVGVPDESTVAEAVACVFPGTGSPVTLSV